MIKRKIRINIHDYPAELHPLLGAGEIYDSSSSPQAQTLYCTAGFYIKTAPKSTLSLEAELCRRFHSMGLGVEVTHYLSTDKDYFVTRCALGDDLLHHLDEPKTVCRILASALRMLHSQPTQNLPVSALFRTYTEPKDAPSNEFLPIKRFPISSKEEALQIIHASKHKLKADTLIHGDACLPNIICHEGNFSTFIDLGQAGVGDRHMDLYWAIWSLEFNLQTDDYTDYFLDLYGADAVDPDVLKLIAALEYLS